MKRLNFLREKIRSGEPVLGSWAVIPSPITADIIASTEIDFLIIDQEHGPISFETAQQMAIACESRGVSPIMRVGGVNEADILKALDIGMHGIQIPNIQNSSDVNRVIAYSKYPPVGNRGFSPFTRAGDYTMENAQHLTQYANEHTILAINIEGKDAINKIDEILTIPELDVIFIGTFDLSKSLGIPGQVEHPDVMQLLDDLTQKINAAGKYAGTITTKPEHIPYYLEKGLKYIVHLVDCEMLRSVYKNIKLNFDRSCHEKYIHN